MLFDSSYLYSLHTKMKQETRRNSFHLILTFRRNCIHFLEVIPLTRAFVQHLHIRLSISSYFQEYLHFYHTTFVSCFSFSFTLAHRVYCMSSLIIVCTSASHFLSLFFFVFFFNIFSFLLFVSWTIS